MSKASNNIVCNVAGHLILEVPCSRNRHARRYMEHCFIDMSTLFWSNTCVAFQCPTDAERFLNYPVEADALAAIHAYAAELKRQCLGE